MVLGLLISLVILAAVFENWRGAREWKQTRALLEKKDITTDFMTLIPEAPSPEKNFASHPLIRSLTDFDDTKEGIEYRNEKLVERFRELTITRLGSSSSKPSSSDWEKRLRISFPVVVEYLDIPVDDSSSAEVQLLKYFEDRSRDIKSLDEAAARPEAILTISFGNDFYENMSLSLPHVNDFIDFLRFQAVRASAAMKAGNAKEAMKAVHTMEATARASGTPPLLIAGLVRKSATNSILSVAWYGLDGMYFDESQLTTLQGYFEREGDALLSNVEQALQFEMSAILIGGCDYMRDINSRESKEAVRVMTETGTESLGSMGLMLMLVPKGIWDHNKALGCRFYLDYIETVRQGTFSNSESDLMARLKERHLRDFFVSMAVPATGNVVYGGFKTATACDLASVAMALELYRIEEGAYPYELSSLVPKYIRNVPIDRFSPDGEPIRYRKEDGRYLLYSVGKNGVDEKGVGARGKVSNIPPEDDISWGYAEFK